MSELEGRLNERQARIEQLRRKRQKQKSEEIPNELTPEPSSVQSISHPQTQSISPSNATTAKIEPVDKPAPLSIGANETVEVVAMRVQQEELRRIELLAEQASESTTNTYTQQTTGNKHNQDMKHDIEGYLRLAELRTKQALADILLYVQSTRNE